jgi:outer membrane protein
MNERNGKTMFRIGSRCRPVETCVTTACLLVLAAVAWAQAPKGGSAGVAAVAKPSEARGAAAQKFAILDMEKIFQNYYKTKAADSNLKKQGDVFFAYAEKLNESRLKLQNEFRLLRDASMNIAISESEKENKRIEAQDKYRQLKTKEAEYAQYNREKQTKLKEDYEAKRREIIDEIRGIVRKRAILEGFSLVLDASGKTLNNIPTLVYWDSSIDITDSVLTELNRGHEDELRKYREAEEAEAEKMSNPAIKPLTRTNQNNEDIE